ncbi:hypothetical protein ACWF94_24475 [Streptomyces sp. NPDC055078]
MSDDPTTVHTLPDTAAADDLTTVRALLDAAGLPASDAETAVLAEGYRASRPLVAGLYAVPGADGEPPALDYDPRQGVEA